MNIVLIGYRGTGKTAVGKALAKKIRFLFLDADKVIEAKAKMPIPEIFKRSGEQHFRDIESAAIKEVCGKERCVIATGGGAPMREENAKAMRKNNVVVLLECSPETIYKRIKDDSNRPALTDLNDKLKEIKFILKERNPVYHAVADFVTSTDKKTIAKNVKEIIGFLKGKHDK